LIKYSFLYFGETKQNNCESIYFSVQVMVIPRCRYRFWILPQTIMSIWILNYLTIHFMLNVSMKSSHNCIPRNHPDFTVTLMINLLEPQTSAVFVQVIRASWLLP